MRTILRIVVQRSGSRTTDPWYVEVPEPYQAGRDETDWYLEWVRAGQREHPENDDRASIRGLGPTIYGDVRRAL